MPGDAEVPVDGVAAEDADKRGAPADCDEGVLIGAPSSGWTGPGEPGAGEGVGDEDGIGDEDGSNRSFPVFGIKLAISGSSPKSSISSFIAPSQAIYRH